jgi:mannose-1-phosphate guanylyltransferase
MALGSKIEGEFNARAFTDCPNISIDYGVMEKTERAWIYPVKFGWSDIGTWESLYTLQEKDQDGNAIAVEKTLIEEAKDTLVLSTDKSKLIAVKGLEGFMVIDTPDALVICPRDDRSFKDFSSGIAMPEFEKYR